jgi:uncharacterized protein (TIGR02246 family)
MTMTTEQRLRALEDERDILRVLHTYGHALDYGVEDAFVDCWTEDAVLHWPGPAPIGGREAIRAAFRAHTHAPEHYHKHIVVDPLVAVDGDRATVHSMFMRLDTIEGKPQIRAFGRYRDTLRREADGKWRLCERIPDIEGRHPAMGSWRSEDFKK